MLKNGKLLHGVYVAVIAASLAGGYLLNASLVKDNFDLRHRMSVLSERTQDAEELAASRPDVTKLQAVNDAVKKFCN